MSPNGQFAQLIKANSHKQSHNQNPPNIPFAVPSPDSSAPLLSPWQTLAPDKLWHLNPERQKGGLWVFVSGESDLLVPLVAKDKTESTKKKKKGRRRIYQAALNKAAYINIFATGILLGGQMDLSRFSRVTSEIP